MEKHKCIDCLYHETESIFIDESDILYCYCTLGHFEIHDESDCEPYNIEHGELVGGQPVECDDFKEG